MQDIHQVFYNPTSIQSDNSETSKVKTQFITQDREGETPYDPTILRKLAVHQDHAISRTRERDRSNT
jgi:hypothetical protein